MFSTILSHTLFALIGAVAGGFVVACLFCGAPDLGIIIRKSVKENWSKEDTLAALNESIERWSKF